MMDVNDLILINTVLDQGPRNIIILIEAVKDWCRFPAGVQGEDKELGNVHINSLESSPGLLVKELADFKGTRYF